MGEWNLSKIPADKQQEIREILELEYEDIWDEECETHPVVLENGVLRFEQDPLFAAMFQVTIKDMRLHVLNFNDLGIACLRYPEFKPLARTICKKNGYSLAGYAELTYLK